MVKDLLLDLVAIPSVSAMSNQPVIEYIRSVLDPRHWNVHLDSYTDGAGVPKTNLVAFTRGAVDRHAELALVCHTDTVPFDADWNEAVHPRLRDGRIYGRGSCDVKGFLACVLAAAGNVDSTRLAKPLAIVLTADEEVGCVGAKRLAAAQAFSARYMIIGEPTSLSPVRGGKGYALGTIVVQGKEGHSAFPADGRSAIYDAARVITGVERVAAQLEREGGDATFDPPFTTVNVGLVQGGTAKNIIAGECRMTIEWRLVPGRDPERVPQLIREMLNSVSATAEFTVLRSDPSFIPSQGRTIADLLSSATGNGPTTIAFGSEAAHLQALTEETVVFGPGTMSVAHKTGEHVMVEDLHRCVEHLETVIRQTCGTETATRDRKRQMP